MSRIMMPVMIAIFCSVMYQVEVVDPDPSTNPQKTPKTPGCKYVINEIDPFTTETDNKGAFIELKASCPQGQKPNWANYKLMKIQMLDLEHGVPSIFWHVNGHSVDVPKVRSFALNDDSGITEYFWVVGRPGRQLPASLVTVLADDHRRVSRIGTSTAPPKNTMMSQYLLKIPKKPTQPTATATTSAPSHDAVESDAVDRSAVMLVLTKTDTSLRQLLNNLVDKQGKSKQKIPIDNAAAATLKKLMVDAAFYSRTGLVRTCSMFQKLCPDLKLTTTFEPIMREYNTGNTLESLWEDAEPAVPTSSSEPPPVVDISESRRRRHDAHHSRPWRYITTDHYRQRRADDDDQSGPSQPQPSQPIPTKPKKMTRAPRKLTDKSMARCAPGAEPYKVQLFKKTTPTPGESNVDACNRGSPVFLRLSSTVALVGVSNVVPAPKRKMIDELLVAEGFEPGNPDSCVDLMQPLSKRDKLSPACKSVQTGSDEAIARDSSLIAEQQTFAGSEGDMCVFDPNADALLGLEADSAQAEETEQLGQDRTAKMHGALQNPETATETMNANLGSVLLSEKVNEHQSTDEAAAETANCPTEVDDETGAFEVEHTGDVNEPVADAIADTASTSRASRPGLTRKSNSENTQQRTSPARRRSFFGTKTLSRDHDQCAPVKQKEYREFTITPPYLNVEHQSLWTSNDLENLEVFSKFGIYNHIGKDWFAAWWNNDRYRDRIMTLTNWVRMSFPDDISDRAEALRQVKIWCHWCKLAIDYRVAHEGLIVTEEILEVLKTNLAAPVALVDVMPRMKSARSDPGGNDYLKKFKFHVGAGASQGLHPTTLNFDGTPAQKMKKGAVHKASIATLEFANNELNADTDNQMSKLGIHVTSSTKSRLASGELSYDVHVTANMFRLVYAEVFVNTAFYNHFDLVTAAGTMGVDIGKSHRSHPSATLMAQHVADQHLFELLKFLCSDRVKHIVIIVDGSETITGTDKLLAVFFRAWEETRSGVGVNEVIALRPVVYFYRLLEMKRGGSADQHQEVLERALREDGEKWLLRAEPIIRDKIYGFVSDGANNMMGKHNGFVMKIQKWKNAKVTAVHCLSHRLELSIKHAWKEGAQRMHLERMVSFLKGIYKFFKNAQRQRRLDYAHQLLDDEDDQRRAEDFEANEDESDAESEKPPKRKQGVGRLSPLIENRWVASLARSANRVERNLPFIWVAMNKLQAEDDSRESEYKMDPISRSHMDAYIQVVMNRHFVSQLAWFNCALEQLTRASTMSQGRYLFSADMYDTMKKLGQWFDGQKTKYATGADPGDYCRNMIALLRKYNCDGHPCKTLQQFEEADVVESRNAGSETIKLFKNDGNVRMTRGGVKNHYSPASKVIPIMANKMNEHLLDTVPNQELFNSMRALKLTHMLNAFDRDQFDYTSYATNEMIVLVEEFAEIQTDDMRAEILRQWADFMSIIGNGDDRHKPESWKRYGMTVTDDNVFWSHAFADPGFVWEDRKELRSVLMRALLLPMSSAEVERGFSIMNNIKTSRRYSLSVANLERRMRIRIDNVPPGEFMAEKYAKSWIAKGKDATTILPNKGMVTQSTFDQKRNYAHLQKWTKEQFDALNRVKMFDRSFIFN